MTPRRLSVALAVSLALNLFLGGFVVARMVLHARRDHHAAFHFNGGPLGHARQKVAQALQRDPLDKAALDDAFAQLRSATTAAQTQLHRDLTELAPTLSPDERMRMLNHLTKRQRHGRHRDQPGRAFEPR